MEPVNAAALHLSIFGRTAAEFQVFDAKLSYIMATQGAIETEVKICISDIEATRELLAKAGFVPSVERVFEANTLFDTREGKLKAGQMLLRLRQAGERNVITWKGPSLPGPHKSRPELETSVGSLRVCAEILRALGYEPTFRYEKYRTEYQKPGVEGTVTVDETPIGCFLELEGTALWIDETAAKLGFEKRSYVLASYGRLYLDYCAENGITPSHMVFPESRQRMSEEQPRTLDK